MTLNPILEEIYAARDKLLAEAGGDIHKYLHDARDRAIASGRPIVEPKQRTKDCTGAANKAVSNGESSPAAQ